MDNPLAAAIWSQFGASIDMLENAMRACPDGLWSDPSEEPAWKEDGVVGFWYLVYHTLFFLDLYSSPSDQGFAPPAPFTLDELDPAGILPKKPFTKAELQTYLDHCREKCRASITALTDEAAGQRCGFPTFELTRAEFFLYSLRHIHHHVGQLHLMLRQAAVTPPRWVVKATALTCSPPQT